MRRAGPGIPSSRGRVGGQAPVPVVGGLPSLRDCPPPRVPSADGPRVPVPSSEGHAGADPAAAGRAPRSPRLPSAEELGLPQQRGCSVSTGGRRGQEGTASGSPPPALAPAVSTQGPQGSLPAALGTRTPWVSSPPALCPPPPRCFTVGPAGPARVEWFL